MGETARAHPPAYVRLADHLTDEIAAGRLVDGARLPPERALAAQMSLAVGTVRRALEVLGERGLIRRVHGSGNYVHAGAARDSLYAMFRLELPGGGGFPGAQLISADLVTPSVDLPVICKGDRINRFRRVRLLDDMPIAVEEIWLDGDAGVLSAKDVSQSMYQSYRDKLGLLIARAEDRVSVAPAPEWVAGLTAMEPGMVVGYVERVGWGEAPRPVEFSRTWFDPRCAVYVQRLK